MCKAHGTCQYHLHSFVILEDISKSSSNTSNHCTILGQDAVSDREDSDMPDETATSKSNASQDSTTLDEESNSNREESDISLMKFFQDRMVTRLIVVEYPHTLCQLYVTENLQKNYHFSCPTVRIPSLFHAIRSKNNINLELLFIPRKCKHYVSKTISVHNGIKEESSMANNKHTQRDPQILSVLVFKLCTLMSSIAQGIVCCHKQSCTSPQ